MPQRWFRGPGPAPNMQRSAEYHQPIQHAAPRAPQTSMIFGENQITPPINDLAYRAFYEPDKTGYGHYVRELATVDVRPIQQWKNALRTPVSFFSMGWKQQLEGGNVLREPDVVHAPLRQQNVPGSIHFQSQVVTSQINARQSLMYQNLRAPGINETQSSIA